MVITGEQEQVSTKTVKVNQHLSVNAIPERTHALKGVSNQFHVLMQLETGPIPAGSAPSRPPVSVCIVLDRSGSMSGDKLDFAKKSIKSIINGLASTDKVHLVAYGSKVVTIFKDGDLKTQRDSLCDQVDNIRTEGMTNLHGGLSEGAKIFEQIGETEGQVNKRIFLFSDGLANVGPSSHKEIWDLVTKIHREKAIDISSFGIGSDFDEDLMQGVSEHGAGVYYFVDKVENIEVYMSNALQGLVAQLGSQAVLKVRGVAPLSTVTKMGDYDLIEGAAIHSIKYDNKKNILTTLEVKPDASEGADILTWELTYTDTQTSEPVKATGSLFLPFTSDESLLEQTNDEVEVAASIQKLADVDEEVEALLQQNKVKEAIDAKNAEVTMLQALKKKDKTGRVEVLERKALFFADNLKKEGNSKRNKKHAKQQMFMKRMDSCEYMCCDAELY